MPSGNTLRNKPLYCPLYWVPLTGDVLYILGMSRLRRVASRISLHVEPLWLARKSRQKTVTADDYSYAMAA